MPVLQTSIRESRSKSLAVTCSQRSQRREMNEYFITSRCRTGAAKRTGTFDSFVATEPVPAYSCGLPRFQHIADFRFFPIRPRSFTFWM